MAYTENMVAAMVAFLVVNLVVVLLRCYVRLWLVKAYGIDDVFLLLAYVSLKPTFRPTVLNAHLNH